MNIDKQPNQLPLSTAQSLLPCDMTDREKIRERYRHFHNECETLRESSKVREGETGRLRESMFVCMRERYF